MPTVTGKLTDFRLGPLDVYQAQISFIPSGPAVTQGDRYLLATRPIVVTTAPDGSFTVELTSTDDVRPDAWYRIQIKWLSPGMPEMDAPQWRLLVPPEGGDISELLLVSMKPGAMDVWIGEVDNPEYRFWYQPSTTLLRR